MKINLRRDEHIEFYIKNITGFIEIKFNIIKDIRTNLCIAVILCLNYVFNKYRIIRIKLYDFIIAKIVQKKDNCIQNLIRRYYKFEMRRCSQVQMKRKTHN